MSHEIRQKTLFSCLLMIIPIISHATLVTTFSVGPAWYSAGETQTFYLQPDVVNTYAAMPQSHVLASGELALSMQRALSPKILGQLGLAIAASSRATLQGEVWQTADSNFNNFTYKYYTSHTHVAVKGKILSTFFSQSWTPYLDASVGVGRNHAFNYSDIPTIFEAVPAPAFNDHRQTAFTYTLGVGMQAMLTAHWALGLGYEFADWGSSGLSRASGQTLNTGIALSHLYTNQLQLNLSYYFS